MCIRDSFGSEPKACFVHPDFEPEIDKQGLQELLSIGPAHTSGTTLFKGLYEVLPGHYISYSKEGLYDEKYWDIVSHEHTDDYARTVEHTRYLVEDSITVSYTHLICSDIRFVFDNK